MMMIMGCATLTGHMHSSGVSQYQRANQRKTVSNSSQMRKRSERETFTKKHSHTTMQNHMAVRASLTASTKAKVDGVHLG
jgi:hypothetical protein